MRKSVVLYGLALLAAETAAINANVMNERVRLAKAWVDQGTQVPPKYFHESDFSGHYDGRFANKPLPLDEQSEHLSNLITSYLSFMEEVGVETWIMHGTLLAWWWNQRVFPWDDDLDVQVSEPGIHFLAERYNMTEQHFHRRKYVLDINPYYIVETTLDKDNVIDGRWIDTSSGLFIDITAVRRDTSRQAQFKPGNRLVCKDLHQYNEEDIFPLRRTVFEGVPAKVPYAYTRLLTLEYGPRSMTNTHFNGYDFSEAEERWIKLPQSETALQ